MSGTYHLYRVSRAAPLSIGFIVVLAVSTVPVPRVVAATFIVNSNADVTNAFCTSAPGGCTLRDAVTAAVVTAGRDTIGFDAAVFPFGAPTTIALATALPPIVDPAGTVVDGAGAGVIIDGLALGAGNGLVIASGAGVPLERAAVANLTVRNFPGNGVLVCGGAPPGCDEDVSGTLIRAVVSSVNDDAGIAVEGRENSRAQVIDSVAVSNAGAGVRLVASGGRALVGARVRGCKAFGNGIFLNAAGDISGALITDSTVARSEGAGLIVRAQGAVSKTKLSNITATGNQDIGIIVNASESLSTVTIAGTIADDNVIGGIEVSAVGANTATTLKDVSASDNGGNGIEIRAGAECVGTKLTAVTVVGSDDIGIVVDGGTASTGHKIARVRITRNGSHGLVLDAAQSSIKQVDAIGNQGSGIQMLAGGGGNKIEKSSASANGQAGILVATGSPRNAIQKNVALGNSGTDLIDQNAACDANSWKTNVFRTRSQPCIE